MSATLDLPLCAVDNDRQSLVTTKWPPGPTHIDVLIPLDGSMSVRGCLDRPKCLVNEPPASQTSQGLDSAANCSRAPL